MNYKFEKNKLYDYLGSYLVSTLKSYKAFVAGGTITSLFSNREINDIDVYFRDEGSLISFIEEIYDDSHDWINALTTKSLLVRVSDKEVQMIHFKYFSDAHEIFDTFDFTVCMGAYDFATEEFFLHDDFLKHNAQRILKFNKNTAFPIVSLLRIQKYKEKGYSISKPEFLRIVMKCMDLKIETLEDLKNHLGGMYGVNYDKLINLKEGEKFTFDLVIDKIEDLSLSEDYFKEPGKIQFNEVEEIIDYISKEPVRITRIHNDTYRIRSNGTIKMTATKPKEAIEYGGKEIVEGRKYYKFVKKHEDKFFSYYDSNYEYIVGKDATPKRDNYLYFNEQREILESPYVHNIGSVLIEVTINYDDFYVKEDDSVLTRRCHVIREVPKEEWSHWVKEEG